MDERRINMWLYEKRLQYPVNVRKPDAKTAKIVISQLGGPNGELGAALRYLNQRYTMPYPRIQALLTDIGTEELAHVEIISTLFYQLTNGLTPQEIKEGGLDAYFTDHIIRLSIQQIVRVFLLVPILSNLWEILFLI